MSLKRTLMAIVIVASVAITFSYAPGQPVSQLSAGPVVVATEYRPSVHGFPFKNSFSRPSDPPIVRALAGRCGGMSYGSLDYFTHGAAPPGDASFDEYLLARSVDSVVANIARFALWSAWPDTTESRLVHGVAQLTRDEEVPRLTAALERGPVPLGLVRAKGIRQIGRNHQVVAYGLTRQDDIVVISVYDSNRPLSDDVRLEIDMSDTAAPIRAYDGDSLMAEWRGLFVERYAPAKPPK